MNLLVLPPATAQYWDWAPPPLGLLYIAAHDREDTQIWDGSQKGDPVPFIESEHPRVVGVTVHTSTRKDAIRILKAAKESGAITVAGGPHFNSSDMARQWKEHYSFVDHIVRGDGEVCWENIVAADGYDCPSSYQRVNPDDAFILPWEKVDPSIYPARDVSRGWVGDVHLGETPRVSLVSSKGCVGRCEFCTAWMRGYVSHSYDFLDRNLHALKEYNIRHICWDDDCWGIDKDLAHRLCDTQASLGMVWQATTRVDVLTQELVNHMASTGCWRIAVGLESSVEKVRAAMNKDVSLDRLREVRGWTRTAGISLSVLMMQGYPGQTEWDEQSDYWFVQSLGPDDIGCLGFTVVLPGTALYARARSAGYVDDTHWLGDEDYLRASREWNLGGK